jgi:aminomethyltransferase
VGLRTPLYALHLEQGARMVDFGGWDMPVHYGSQIEEHHAVRRRAGMFDVSHMCVIDLEGARVRPFLEQLLANDPGKLRTPGKALYSCLLREDGGILDDLIVYFLTESWFRLVVNAGTREKDLAWIRARAASFGVEVVERVDLAMLAVQGPQARDLAAAALAPAHREEALALAAFCGASLGSWFIGRTGYTGEDGFEIMLPADAAAQLWRDLLAFGVAACGLGARDTLRLEAGMNLYGSDMDEATHPLESGLGWTVAFEPAQRAFIGRPALERIKAAGSRRRQVGLLLEERGVLRGHQRVIIAGSDTGPARDPAMVPDMGEVTSGTFSPTLEKSIGFARIPATTVDRVEVEIRGKRLAARVVRPPFVRLGRALVT